MMTSTEIRVTACRRGFTFLEVLFAIMILGIGFILVAAMFPAAIKQTQATVEDSASSGIGISAFRKLVEMAKTPVSAAVAPPNGSYILDSVMPGDGKVYSFGDTRLSAINQQALRAFIGSELLVDTDYRYGCVPMFIRNADKNGRALPEAQLFLIPVRCRNKSRYDSSDVYTNANKVNPPLSPSTVTVSITGGLAPTIQLTSASDDNNPAGSGAYIVISDASDKTKNGSIYRLGEHLQSNPPTYTLAPDTQASLDFSNPATNYTAKALVVGRAPTSGGYDGGVQDLGILTVPLRVAP